MKPLTLVHTSDVHVQSEDDFEILDRIGGIFDQRNADLLLIAGDLFDHARLASTFVERVLAYLPTPAAIIPGNHDVHDESSPYSDAAIADGLTMLDEHAGKAVRLLDGAITLWGRAMPAHAREYRPLEGAPGRPDDGWYVVMGHGHYEEQPEPLGRSSPIAPQEIAATEADYVALGHWHMSRDLSVDGVVAWYSGAPSGVASTGCVNVVHLDPDSGVTVEQVPLS